MSKTKALAIALTFVFIFLIPLSGCNTSAPSTHNERRLNKFPEKNDLAAKGGEQKRAQDESSLPGPVVAIPEARAGESTAGQVYKPVNSVTPAKCVYLTFDDGPNSYFTGQILDILAEHQVKASFMVVGVNAEKNPELIKRMVAEGHAVINHTYTHNYKKIYASPEALIADLDQASRVLEKILGRPVKIFRAPGGPGRLTKAFYKKLKEHGYQLVGWNITGADSDLKGVTPEQVYEHVVNGLAKVEKMHLTPIILLHDGTQLDTIEAAANSTLEKYIQNRKSVVDALPKIIELLKSKGYTFAPVDENTPPPW